MKLTKAQMNLLCTLSKTTGMYINVLYTPRHRLNALGLITGITNHVRTEDRLCVWCTITDAGRQYLKEHHAR